MNSESFKSVLNVGFWNISGLQNKIDSTCPDVEHNSFQQFIQTFDVLCFIETWAYKLKQFSVDGFECYDVIRQKHAKAFRNSGGLAVFINKQLYSMFDISNINSESNNMLWIKFDIKPKFWNYGFNIICGFVYMSPEGSSVHAEENMFFVIEDELANLKNTYPNHKVLIGGDFNAYTNEDPDYIQFDSISHVLEDVDYIEDIIPPDRHNLDKKDTNSYGRALLELCKSSGLRILNGRFGKDATNGNFTCITENSASVIDYFISEPELFDNISDLEIHERLESIHMPVRLELHFAAISSISGHTNNLDQGISENKKYSRYYFNNEVQQEYVQKLSQQLEGMLLSFVNLIENDHVLAALEKLMQCITTAAECMKKSKNAVMTISSNCTSQPWFDNECECFRTETLKALRLFRATRSYETLSNYQASKKTYRSMISHKKDDYRNLQTIKLETACNDNSPKEFWNFLKSKQQISIVHISQYEWFNYFSKLFNPETDSDTEHVFNDDETTRLTNETLDASITTSEIRASIMDLKNEKSPGLDGIPAEFFKVACDKFLPYFEILFNNFYNDSFFPEDWSVSTISPIPKTGDKSKPNNYRGISLQPVVSKIFTNILNKRLIEWSNENDVIGEEQAGYRKSYSTVDNLFCLQTVVTKYLRNKGGRFYAAFVDFEKAFDRVDRNALWNKLQMLKVSSKMSKMLQSIYSSVKACVKTKTGLTPVFNCPVGVRQGCCISPILFSFFLNDLKDFVSTDSYGIDLDICKIFLLLFADDLVLLAETKIELQRLLNKLKSYCTTWNLKVNLNKTNVIVFRNGGYLRRYEKWFYGDTKLKVVTYYKYLGLVISSRLSWYMCQKTLAEQASKAVFSLKSNLNKFGYLSANLLLKIFDTKILPILTYAAEIWYSHESLDVEKIHHDFCKYILRIPKRSPNIFARGELGRHTIYMTRCLKLIKYWLRILRLEDNRYPKVCYKLQYKWINQNPRTDCWARQVKEVLEKYGFGYVWSHQGVDNERIFISILKQRLFDIEIQSWRCDVQEMDKLRTYEILKENLVCEFYLNEKIIAPYRHVMSKLRGGFLDLRVHTGRYENTPYEDRMCPVCNTAVENEFHLLFECSLYMTARQKYIPKYYFTHPSYDKFKELMLKQNPILLLNICKFLVFALKLRDTFLTTNV